MLLGGLTTVVTAAGVAILIYLTLSEKSRRKECELKMGRIGFAINGYCDTDPAKAFPRAALPNAALPYDQRLSWVVEALPYLEAGNRPARSCSASMTASICSAPGAIRQTLRRPTRCLRPFFALATRISTRVCVLLHTHYIGCAGLGRDAASLPLTDRNAGFFVYERLITENVVTAGSS